MTRQEWREHAVSRFTEAVSKESERLGSIPKTMQEENSMRALLLQIYRVSAWEYGGCVSVLPIVHSHSR
jgi:hypothetical protein